MALTEIIGRLGKAIAPRTCAFCDGGSGVIVDSDRATFHRCDACGGTGLASPAEANLQTAVNDRIRAARRPSGD